MPIAVSDIDRFRFIHCRATDLLTDEQVSALGIVAAEFGLLEAALNSHGQRLFMLRIPFTQMTGNAGATRHSELLLDAVGRYCDGVPDIVAHITKYLRDVPGLAVRRNEYVHAAWGTVFEATGRTYGYKTDVGMTWKERGRKYKFFSGKPEDMLSLADDIARVRYEINRGFGALPMPYGSEVPL